MNSILLATLNCPPRLKPLRHAFSDRPIRILDVGCGNHSPTITKHWFPRAEYHGADIQTYNLDARDQSNMDRFFLLTTDGGGYENIPDDDYDFIICNHVIEHIKEQESALKNICAKLKPGGLIWGSISFAAQP